MKKLLILVLAAAMVFAVSCKKDKTPPVVSAPANQEVVIGESIDVTFTFDAEAGFKSSSVSANNGTFYGEDAP